MGRLAFSLLLHVGILVSSAVADSSSPFRPRRATVNGELKGKINADDSFLNGKIVSSEAAEVASASQSSYSAQMRRLVNGDQPGSSTVTIRAGGDINIDAEQMSGGALTRTPREADALEEVDRDEVPLNQEVYLIGGRTKGALKTCDDLTTAGFKSCAMVGGVYLNSRDDPQLSAYKNYVKVPLRLISDEIGKGTAGSFLAHLRIWMAVAEGSVERVFVMENDEKVKNATRIHQMLHDPAFAFDFVNLNGLRPKGDPVAVNGQTWLKIKHHDKLLKAPKYNNVLSTAYAITKPFAIYFLEQMKQKPADIDAFDWYLSKLWNNDPAFADKNLFIWPNHELTAHSEAHSGRRSADKKAW